jgi:IclR family transcriptional regulator, acetate operon repressor
MAKKPSPPPVEPSPEASNGYRGPHLQTLKRGIDVLFYVAGSATPVTARTIAEHLGIDRTITHRILRTLVSEKLLAVGDARYSLAARVALVGQSFLDQLVVRHVAMPFQVDLLYRTFEGRPWSISLSLAVDDQLMIINQLWAPNAPLNSIMSIGTRLPLEQTSAGRTILAFSPTEHVVEILGEDRADKLRDRLENIRDAGGVDFAQNEPHIPPGLVALGAVIRGRAGEPIAGLSLSGPGLEDHLDVRGDVATQLRRTAEQIGRSCP